MKLTNPTGRCNIKHQRCHIAIGQNRSMTYKACQRTKCYRCLVYGICILNLCQGLHMCGCYSKINVWMFHSTSPWYTSLFVIHTSFWRLQVGDEMMMKWWWILKKKNHSVYPSASICWLNLTPCITDTPPPQKKKNKKKHTNKKSCPSEPTLRYETSLFKNTSTY